MFFLTPMTKINSILVPALQYFAVFGLAFFMVTSALAVEPRIAMGASHADRAPIVMTCSSVVRVNENGKLRIVSSEIHDCSEVSK